MGAQPDKAYYGITSGFGAGYQDATGFSYLLPDRIDGVNYEPYAQSISFSTEYSFQVDPTPFDLNPPLENGTDAGFFITAAHEIGHVLGIGVAPAFDARIVGTTFDGPNARAINGGNPIPLKAPNDLGHLADFTTPDGLPALLGGGGGAGAFIPTKVDLAVLADVGYKFQGFTAQDSTPTTATEENDNVLGTDLADTLNGLGGNDTINGVAGNDSLIGGTGNDKLDGGGGNDSLSGGVGNDNLTGGGGSDTFIFEAASGEDQIADFVVADDKIQLAASLGFSDGAAVLSAPGNFFNGTVTDANGNPIPGLRFSQITLSSGNIIKINSDNTPLTAANFTII